MQIKTNHNKYLKVTDGFACSAIFFLLMLFSVLTSHHYAIKCLPEYLQLHTNFSLLFNHKAHMHNLFELCTFHKKLSTRSQLNNTLIAFDSNGQVQKCLQFNLKHIPNVIIKFMTRSARIPHVSTFLNSILHSVFLHYQSNSHPSQEVSKRWCCKV